MTVTDQQILDAAKQRLLDIINGRVAEFSEGNDRARMLAIDQLERLVQEYEQKISDANGSSPVFRPMR